MCVCVCPNLPGCILEPSGCFSLPPPKTLTNDASCQAHLVVLTTAFPPVPSVPKGQVLNWIPWGKQLPLQPHALQAAAPALPPLTPPPRPPRSLELPLTSDPGSTNSKSPPLIIGVLPETPLTQLIVNPPRTTSFLLPRSLPVAPSTLKWGACHLAWWLMKKRKSF